MKKKMNETIPGTIFDIKRFALYDGPGIRTTVFVKGCPLRCVWCHNPESLSFKPTLFFTKHRCIGCGECLRVCPQKAHRLGNGGHVINRVLCKNCGACAAVCFAAALEWVGREVTVSEVVEEVLRDRPFYVSSGGGATISGGEPLTQANFTLALLETLKRKGIHTALDTSGYAAWKCLERLLPCADLILYDLKHMDSQRHRQLTGVSNRRILDNLSRLDRARKSLWIRIPLVPGYNDEEKNYHTLGLFLSGLHHIERIEILPYHRLAESKYAQMGIEYSSTKLQEPERELIESRRQILLGHGLTQAKVAETDTSD